MRIKTVYTILLKVIDDYIPSIAFVIMFIAFNVQIFTRYVLNDPAGWPWDITIIGFIWTILLSSIHSVRTHEHVQFALIYTKQSEWGKAIFRLISEVILVFTLAIAIYPSWDYIWFTRIMKSGVLRIPLIYIFFPFMFFIVLSTVFLFVDLIHDARFIMLSFKKKRRSRKSEENSSEEGGKS